VGNSIKYLSQQQSDALPHWEFYQGFATFRLLAWCLYHLSHAAVKVGNSIKGLSQGHSDALLHWESNQGFTTFQSLAQHLNKLSLAAASLVAQ